MKNNDSFISVPALEVSQPFGVFYVTKLNAGVLLDITFEDPLRVTDKATEENPYGLTGAQREQKLKRLREIGDFISTAEAAFPNSIILGANYTEDGELLEPDDNSRWYVTTDGDSDCLRLVIPTSDKLASVIDGQHRLNGFLHADEERFSMELLCAVYLDIPIAYQAYIFATINFNQKKVDRSQAYELFGIRLEEESPHSWSPEKTAVFLCRRLNTEQGSPLRDHIIIAAQKDEILERNKREVTTWAVSTATVVDGILRLFSSNPKRDRVKMYRKTIEAGRSRTMLSDDGTPLRGLFLKTNDLAIYKIVENYFLAVEQTLWSEPAIRSYIKKTVGIQALFDVLLLIMRRFTKENTRSVNISRDLNSSFFKSYLANASHIDFSDSFFQASGKGRTRIKNTVALSVGLASRSDVPAGDLRDYLRLTS